MQAHSISRRRFLKAAGLTVAGATLAGAGLGYAATSAPAIDTPDLISGREAAMNQRILVTYATRAGATAEVATAIAEHLNTSGYAVDVKPVAAMPSLAGYDAVVMGSAIRMGSWLPEAVDFVKANRAALQVLPVALFTVHLLNTGDDAASQAARQEYLKAVRPLLNSAEEVYFEGLMDYSRLSFLDRTIARLVKVAEADHRDWVAIRSWTPAALASAGSSLRGE